MDLVSFLEKEVEVELRDRKIISGRVVDYTTSEDNDDEGAYIVINPKSGELKHRSIAIFESDIKKITKL